MCLIDSVNLKLTLERLKFHKDDDWIEQFFNRGLQSAIEVIEIYEKAERKYGVGVKG